MVFVETSVFTNAVVEVLTDDEYRALQTALIVRPSQGAVLRGTGGLRKVRWRPVAGSVEACERSTTGTSRTIGSTSY